MRNPYICVAVLLRAVWTDSLRLFGCFWRIRAITQGEGEWKLPEDNIFDMLFRKYIMTRITFEQQAIPETIEMFIRVHSKPHI